MCALWCTEHRPEHVAPVLSSSSRHCCCSSLLIRSLVSLVPSHHSYSSIEHPQNLPGSLLATAEPSLTRVTIREPMCRVFSATSAATHYRSGPSKLQSSGFNTVQYWFLVSPSESALQRATVFSGPQASVPYPGARALYALTELMHVDGVALAPQCSHTPPIRDIAEL